MGLESQPEAGMTNLVVAARVDQAVLAVQAVYSDHAKAMDRADRLPEIGSETLAEAESETLWVGTVLSS